MRWRIEKFGIEERKGSVRKEECAHIQFFLQIYAKIMHLVQKFTSLKMHPVNKEWGGGRPIRPQLSNLPLPLRHATNLCG